MEQTKDACAVGAACEPGSAVPVHRKLLLTLSEAAAYTGLGINRLRELSHDREFEEEVVYLSGRRRYFRRARLERWFEEDCGSGMCDYDLAP